MSSRVFGLLAALAVMLAATTIQADTLIPCYNDDLSSYGGEAFGQGYGPPPANMWIDMPALAGCNGSVDAGEGENGMNRINIWPGWDGQSGYVRAYPASPAGALPDDLYPNNETGIFSNIYNLGTTLSSFPGADGVQAGHTYQFTVGVAQYGNYSTDDSTDFAPAGIPGPLFQAFLVDADPNYQTDGRPEYTDLAPGPQVTSTTSWQDISSATWMAPSTSAGDNLELGVIVTGYYGLPTAYYATMGDVSNFRLYDVTPVPEPGTMTLLAAGLGGLLVVARRRRRA